jgi:hypothetical protein
VTATGRAPQPKSRTATGKGPQAKSVSATGKAPQAKAAGLTLKESQAKVAAEEESKAEREVRSLASSAAANLEAMASLAEGESEQVQVWVGSLQNELDIWQKSRRRTLGYIRTRDRLKKWREALNKQQEDGDVRTLHILAMDARSAVQTLSHKPLPDSYLAAVGDFVERWSAKPMLQRDATEDDDILQVVKISEAVATFLSEQSEDWAIERLPGFKERLVTRREDIIEQWESAKESIEAIADLRQPVRADDPAEWASTRSNPPPFGS